METEMEKTRAQLLGRVDPGAFKICAYVLAVGIVATTRFLGGSWLAVFAGTLLVAAATYVLPVRAPSGGLRKQVVSQFVRIQSLSRLIRLASVVLAFIAIACADYALGGFALGRGFNLFLLPIFLASLLFGLRVAVFAWLLGVAFTYFCVIPPEFSFALGSLKDFAELFVFIYLGIFVLAIPVLLRASAYIE